MMSKSTPLGRWLTSLEARARARGLTDAQWAGRAGVRKETLSRLRSRDDCDLATLRALAEAVDAQFELREGAAPATPTSADGHMPGELLRAHEERLVELALSRELEPAKWRAEGPPFFMAGLAVLLAGHAALDRRDLLELAEFLHPGATEPVVFGRWLERSPLQAGRFLAFVDAGLAHAA